MPNHVASIVHLIQKLPMAMAWPVLHRITPHVRGVPRCLPLILSSIPPTVVERVLLYVFQERRAVRQHKNMLRTTAVLK